MVTHERVKELFTYDSEIGDLTRKVSKPCAKKGSVVACKDSHGYIQVSIDNKRYLAHRIVWLWCYGYIPENAIDHINRDRADNRLHNLREVSTSCNCRNSANYNSNTSGVKGVQWHKRYLKWQVQITLNWKRKSAGVYSSFDEAVCARLAAEQCLDWAGCDSNSPAYQYVTCKIQGDIT